MNPNNEPAEIGSSPPETNTEILDEFPNIPKGDASLNKPTSTDFDDLQHLICHRFGLCEKIYKRILDHGFDIESLLVATESDIKELFPIPLLGTRAKFRYHLNIWRKDASTLSVSNSCREWIDSNLVTNDRTSVSPSSSTGCENSPFTDTTLLELLKGSEKGVDVLNEYKAKSVLHESSKDILTSVIVDSFSNNNKVMSMQDIVSATNAIITIFPSENKNYYLNKRGRGLNPTGKLHDKAVNARVKIRNLKKRRINDGPYPSTSISIPELETNISESDVNTEDIIWLTHNNEPWAVVEAKWTSVLHIRQLDIKTADTQTILKKWPLFKHSLGHALVEIDYNIRNKL